MPLLWIAGSWVVGWGVGYYVGQMTGQKKQRKKLTQLEATRMSRARKILAAKRAAA